MEIRSRSDSGQPIVATNPDSAHAGIYRTIAKTMWSGLAASSSDKSEPPALEISTASDGLNVRFNDGRAYALSAEMLRVMSPSAEVQGHSPSQRVTVGGKRHVKIKGLKPVGNYAVRIVFDDGHDSGLFAWEYLDQLGREKEQRWGQYLSELKDKGLSRD